MHSAHRVVGVSAPLAVLQRGDAAAGHREHHGRTVRVGLIARRLDDTTDESLRALETYLTQRLDADCLWAFSKAGNEFPVAESLARFDCLVSAARGITIVGGQIAEHRWPELPEAAEQVEEDCHDCRQGELVQVRVVEAAKEHPVLGGVGPFSSRGPFDPEAEPQTDGAVLLTAEVAGRTLPLAWTHHCGGARVFYTALGRPGEFGNPHFLRLLGNAVRWAAGRSG